MNKNIAIKLVIVLAVSTLVYSIFWFFKVGQVEKQVNNFISENSAYISAGEVSVSGFPTSQKITITDLKFVLPTPLLDKRQAIIKHLEATAGVFSSEFNVTLPEGVSLQDADGNAATVEFNTPPEIKISLSNNRIAALSYKDSGYKIVDMEKNVIYAASSSTLHIESNTDNSDKISTKISAKIMDIEGFDVLNVYKNALEKKVMEGIKTGEIAFGNASVALIPSQVSEPQSVSVATPQITTPQATNEAAKEPAASITTPASTTPDQPSSDDQSLATNTPEVEVKVAAEENVVKSNLSLEMQYDLMPNQEEKQAQAIPVDPTQIQDLPVQYNKVIKITNLEFSNTLYKIMVNSEIKTFADDNMPSGAMTIKVEKIDNLIGHLATSFSQMAEQKKPATEVQTSDLANSGVTVQDSYQDFLRRVSTNLCPVAKELAAKNPVSKEDIAQFDLRREKNLEFLVNETSLREILGKF